MPNSAVKGVVNDRFGAPVAGVLVAAFDAEAFFGERLLADTHVPPDPVLPGCVRTGTDGTFAISYSPGQYALQVRTYSQTLRELTNSPTIAGVTVDVFELPDPITLSSRGVDLDGWMATGGAFPEIDNGSNVRFLVDNDECWSQVIDAVNNARASINWMLFYLDIGKSGLKFDPVTHVPSIGGRLEDALKAASAKGVAVRMVCNDLTLFGGLSNGVEKLGLSMPYPATSAKQVEDWFRANAPMVQVRRMKTPTYTPIHTKFVVFDDATAFVLGSPFVQDYFDDSNHAIDNGRRGTFDDTLCDSHGIKQPTHDVSLFVEGSAVSALNDTFLLHWNAARGPNDPQGLPSPRTPALQDSDCAVQVVRTLTGNGRFAPFPEGETSILEAYLRAIGNAKKYIYLENQYFTSEEIADAVISAVRSRPDLNVVFLTNNAVDIPGYDKWQPATILRVRDGLSSDQNKLKRVGFFTLWSHEDGTSMRICRNYIHSKVAIIDDVWATIGSANLDGASLSYSQNSVRGLYWALGGLFSLRQSGVLKQNRESETNLVFYSDAAGQRHSEFPSALRRRLWAEHLGFLDMRNQPNPDDDNLKNMPASGWLKLWQDRANAKLAGMLGTAHDPTPVVNPARILPYPLYSDQDWLQRKLGFGDPHFMLKDARFYLQAFGADASKLGLVPHYRRYSWDKGDWDDG